MYSNSKDNPSIKNQIEVIKRSRLFDEQYYLMNNKDVAAAKIDPVEHFCLYGWKEYRNPSKLFDTKFYLEQNMDILKAGINPLYHYIILGEKEGRKPGNDSVVDLVFTHEQKINKKDDKVSSIFSETIDIIVPVYNGYHHLEFLFESLKTYTDLKYRLIVINDCSDDERIQPYLEKIIHKFPHNSIILENEVNIGFVRTVNKAAKLVNGNFVMLNTDVQLPENWLSRLMQPVFDDPSIASVTPFSNAATILSFPEPYVDNQIDKETFKRIDKLFQQIQYDVRDTELDIPTGVGFCMGINKTVWDKIGEFDEAFSPGYGEENDWCQRAIKSGYRNIFVPNLYVYHKHGGSFASTKEILTKRNSKLLLEKHPNYNLDVVKWITKNPTKKFRAVVLNLLFGKSK